MNSFSKKEQIAIIGIIFLVLISIGYRFFLKDYLNKEDKISVDYSSHELSNPIEDKSPMEIIVHVSGQVYKPGLVTLNTGDRVIDAVNLAGGLKKEADSDKINLARKVHDEEKIHIPSLGQDPIQDGQAPDIVNSKININLCSKTDLESLPGIGPATADKIINYRDNNPFRRIEDLMNVSGIGEKKFEALKDSIIAP